MSMNGLESICFSCCLPAQGCGVRRQVCLLIISAGDSLNAYIAFLPSSFALYANMLAFSFTLSPTRVKKPRTTDLRTLLATLIFAVGAIFGWPFSILASFPFVFEELFIYSGDKVANSLAGQWVAERWIRMFGSVVLASLLFVSVIHSFLRRTD